MHCLIIIVERCQGSLAFAVSSTQGESSYNKALLRKAQSLRSPARHALAAYETSLGLLSYPKGVTLAERIFLRGCYVVFMFSDYTLDVDRRELRRGSDRFRSSRRFSIC